MTQTVTRQPLRFLSQANAALQLYHYRCTDVQHYWGHFPKERLERAPAFYQVEAIRSLRQLALKAQDAGSMVEAMTLMHYIEAWEEGDYPPAPFVEDLPMPGMNTHVTRGVGA